jgi:ubiquitin C-terminal hydrolase
MKKQNKSIISKIFYILTESEMKCQNCSKVKSSYQVTYFLEFPLEAIDEFCNKNNIKTNFKTENMKNKKIIPIDACFLHYSETKIFSGENQIYCNFCNKQANGIFLNRVYSLSPYIILILNRGRGNVFDCDVDFPQILNLEKFTQNKTNYNYKLKGVITHLGTSDLGGHFLAFCRHRIDDKWYCYNDAIVTLCQDQENGFRKGTPYILFYESINGDKNFVFDDNINSNQNNLNCNNNFNKAMTYGNTNNGLGMNFMTMNNKTFNNILLNLI